MTALAPALQAYFTERLINQRAASPNTIAAYRTTSRRAPRVPGEPLNMPTRETQLLKQANGSQATIGITQRSAQSCMRRCRHNHDLRHVAATLALTAGVDIKVVSEQLGHSTTQITRDIYLSVMPQVAQAAAEATAAIVPRAAKSADVHDSVDTLCAPGDISDTEDDLQAGKTPGQKGWGGWDSNPGPRDYESLALTG
jgi:integrase